MKVSQSQASMPTTKPGQSPDARSVDLGAKTALVAALVHSGSVDTFDASRADTWSTFQSDAHASAAKALDATATTAANAFAKEMARDSFDATAASSIVNLGGSRWELGKFPSIPSKAGRPEGRSGEANKSSSSGLSEDGAAALTGPRPTLERVPTDKAPNPTSLEGTKFADLDPSAGMDSAHVAQPGANRGAGLQADAGDGAAKTVGTAAAALTGVLKVAADAVKITTALGEAAAFASGTAQVAAIGGAAAAGAALGTAFMAGYAIGTLIDQTLIKVPGGDKLPDPLPGQDSLAKEAMNRIIAQKTQSTENWQVRPADVSDAASRDTSQPSKGVNGLVNPASLEVRDYSAAAAKTQARATIGAQSVINPVQPEVSVNGHKPG